MAHLIRCMDWGQTPLGPCRSWPQSLKTVLDLMLPAKVKMVLFWGPDQLAFYNDAYAPWIGARHPQALGQPGRMGWRKPWAELEPVLLEVLASGETFSAQDRLFPVSRQGQRETAYFDISCSAVRDEAGAVAGVLCIVNETTQRLLDARALDAKEAALRNEQAFTRLLLESTSEGFYAVDTQGVTTLCNAAFLKLFGYEAADEVMGRRLHPTLPRTPATDTLDLDSACPIQQAALTGSAGVCHGSSFLP